MPKDPRDEQQRLFEFLAESVLEASDEDLLAEAREEGEDPEKSSQQVTAVFEAAVAMCARRERERLRAAYKSHVASIEGRELQLPETPEAQLSLLAKILATNPGLRPGVLTLQYRELSELSPADVEGCLRKLYELGVVELKEDSD